MKVYELFHEIGIPPYRHSILTESLLLRQLYSGPNRAQSVITTLFVLLTILI